MGKSRFFTLHFSIFIAALLCGMPQGRAAESHVAESHAMESHAAESRAAESAAEQSSAAEFHAAEPRAAELLQRLAAGFRAMPGYGVDFEVAAGEYRARGNYAVEGVRYYLALGDAEVFADGSVRYEVDNRRREITVTQVDSASRNILNNPVRAFDFLDSQYAPALLSEADGRAVVRLVPTAENNSPAGNITLTVSTAPVRPLSLVYDYDGEQVTVSVLRVAPLTGQIPLFDRTNYEGYEFIDFR